MKQVITLLLAIAALASCKHPNTGSTTGPSAMEGDTLTIHSNLLTMVEYADGCKEVTIANPWTDKGVPLQRMLLVPHDSTIPEAIPAGVSVVRVPVHKMGVYSSVHTGGMKELGCLSQIAGVADVAYFPKDDTILTLVKHGIISNLGSSQAPSVEAIAASGLEVILRSPMEGLASGTLPAGTLPVEMADYMETSPIGRAEWILLIGALCGKNVEAQELLDSVIACYSDLHLKASLALTPKPKVLTETEQSGVWYVPSPGSYMGRFITDAGGELPWGQTSATGSIPMSLEAVAAKAMDADVWLVRTYGTDADAESLVKMNPRYASFRPIKEKKVWTSNTAEVPLFDDIAFHPERLLADYIAIFHPEVLPDHKLHYFKKSK